MDKLKSRKLWLTIAVVVILFVYLWFGKVSDTVAVPSIIALLGLYQGANVAQKKVLIHGEEL